MTFFSFEQKEIEKEFARINDLVDEIDNMSMEERKEKLIPFDEMEKNQHKLSK